MDTEQFSAPPLTTGGLKAHYHCYGEHVEERSIELVHFSDPAAIATWIRSEWACAVRPHADVRIQLLHVERR
jgi:hypothetical protein